MVSAKVVVVIDDLFFLAKVRTVLDHLGLTTEVITRSEALQASVQAQTPTALIILDLTLRTADAVTLVRTLRASADGQTVPVLAFGAHVAVEIRQQALQAGATQVVTKAEFSQRLPALVQQFVGVPGASQEK